MVDERKEESETQLYYQKFLGGNRQKLKQYAEVNEKLREKILNYDFGAKQTEIFRYKEKKTVEEMLL